jgi:acyl-CoA hydrolase
VFRFLAAPADANWGGKAHGGTVMRWIDEAA